MNENEKFKNSFNFKNEDFFDIVDLTDIKTGFSIKKKMKPEGYYSLFKFFIRENETDNEKYKPIFIRVSYGKMDSNGSIIVSSSTDKIKTWKSPVDLISKDDFFYDPMNVIFYDRHKNQIDANDILKYIYKLHIKPTKLFSGFFLRNELIFFHKIMPDVLKAIYHVLASVLYLISGTKVAKTSLWNPKEKIIKKDNISNDTNQKTEFKREKMEIFGYKGSFGSIIFFVGLHFIFFLVFFTFNYRPRIITTILNNGFLTLIYTISVLSLIELVLPKILEYLIRKNSELFLYFSFKEIKL